MRNVWGCSGADGARVLLCRRFWLQTLNRDHDYPVEIYAQGSRWVRRGRRDKPCDRAAGPRGGRAARWDRATGSVYGSLRQRLRTLHALSNSFCHDYFMTS